MGLAEKARRLLEALTVEAGYGGSIEVSENAILWDGDEKQVRLLNLGRIGLCFLTPDAGAAGWFNRTSDQWEILPQKFQRTLTRVVEMVGKRRPNYSPTE